MSNADDRQRSVWDTNIPYIVVAFLAVIALNVGEAMSAAVELARVTMYGVLVIAAGAFAVGVLLAGYAEFRKHRST